MKINEILRRIKNVQTGNENISFIERTWKRFL